MNYHSPDHLCWTFGTCSTITMTMLLILMILMTMMMPLTSGGNVPSAEMLQATTMEEYQRLRSLAGGSSINETLKDEIYQQKHRQLEATSQPLLASSFNNVPGFYHGVASGDPLPNAVIIWTRYTPLTVDAEITFELRISPLVTGLDLTLHFDPEQNVLLRRTKVMVNGTSDWIAKVDVTGLVSNTNYVYAFTELSTNTVSPIGQTKTAPDVTADVSQLVYAVFSCANFGNGYFHAYDIASTIKDLDFWVHVGDYIYEYGSYSTYASDHEERKKQILPLWETIDLQDYRLRHATYNGDNALQNLRRRAPLIAIWDDHETTNNSYGQGTVDNSGAENHQPTCPVGETATAEEKEEAGCDRNEGAVDIRFTNAAQAYMEWMPIRRGPGTMGVVTTTSITQVIEWGTLATIAAFDTRISYRSKTPTVTDFFDFFELAFSKRNVNRYGRSPLKQQFAEAAAKVQAEANNPSYTMIGDNIEVLRNSFTASKEAGKTWQIWAGATMLGPLIGPNLDDAPKLVSFFVRPLVSLYFNIVLRTEAAAPGRVLVAMARSKTPLNADDFNGFGAERAEILKIAKDNTNNPIILGGDLHDSWAWRLFEGGNLTGTPVAVNLGCPGVSSPGFGTAVSPFLLPIKALLGGENGAYKLIDDMFYRENPGLVYANTRDKGFFAVKATPTSHVAEYFLISAETILQNYGDAVSDSGKLTADFYCGSSLVTTAGEKGSLVRNTACSAIEFTTSRPAEWNIPFPVGSTESLNTLTGCDFNACLYVEDDEES